MKGTEGRTTMSHSEVERYRVMLEAKKTELSSSLRSREDIAVEKMADTLDAVQLAGERELAIRNLDRESKLLRSILSALARIEDGSYGVCLHCETAINAKRLAAVPWAAYCVRCQEAADRYEFESDTANSALELLVA
jgi:DnaK suppressor protein